MKPLARGTLLFLESYDESLTGLLSEHGYDILQQYEPREAEREKVVAIFSKVSKEIPYELIFRYPNLRFVVIPATGTDLVDRRAIENKKIQVLSLRDERSPVKEFTSTTEIFLWHLISLSRHAYRAAIAVEAGKWDRNDHIGSNLKGSVLGIIGLGRIGLQIARICAAVGMHIIGYDLINRNEDVEGIEVLDSIEDLVSRSHIISLNIDDRSSNSDFVNSQILKFAKSLILINTSRGFVVDERSIVNALRSGHLSGYGADVIKGEGNTGDWLKSNILWQAMTDEKLNITLTPHIGGATCENIFRSEEFVVHRFLELDKSRV